MCTANRYWRRASRVPSKADACVTYTWDDVKNVNLTVPNTNSTDHNRFGETGSLSDSEDILPNLWSSRSPLQWLQSSACHRSLSSPTWIPSTPSSFSIVTQPKILCAFLCSHTCYIEANSVLPIVAGTALNTGCLNWARNTEVVFVRSMHVSEIAQRIEIKFSIWSLYLNLLIEFHVRSLQANVTFSWLENKYFCVWKWSNLHWFVRLCNVTQVSCLFQVWFYRLLLWACRPVSKDVACGCTHYVVHPHSTIRFVTVLLWPVCCSIYCLVPLPCSSEVENAWS